MFENYYLIKISGKDVNRFIRKLYNNSIYMDYIEWFDKCVYIKINKENYQKLLKIKTIYEVKTVRLYGFIKLIDIFKRHNIFIITFLIGLLYLLMLSNIIFDVDVIHSKKEIRNIVYEELKHYGITKYHFVKTYNEKEKIEVNILNKYKDKIEWIEINRIGTKYEIRLEERIIKEPKNEQDVRNITAKKDGIILKIESTKGEIIKKINDYVKKGDIIISGSITKNDEVKNMVAAEGNVYAEVWYKTTIDMPYYYKEEKNTGKSHKVLKLRIINKDIYFLNLNKYKTYKEYNIISLKNNLLPIRLCISKEKETNLYERLYSNEEAIKVAKELSYKKMKEGLKEEEKILKQKVIETNEYENYVNVVIFYKVYENITDYSKIDLNQNYKKEEQ